MPLSQRTKEWNNDLNSIAVHPGNNHRFKRVRRIKIKYGTLLCAVLVLCVFVNLVQFHWEIVKLDKEIDVQVQEKQQLLTYQTQLEEDMEMVKSGDYIEKLAREQLGMVKPGEKPVETTNSGDISN